MKRLATKTNEPKASSGYRGVWNPEGDAMYLGGSKYVVNKQLLTICLPLENVDRGYLKTIKKTELFTADDMGPENKKTSSIDS